MRIRRTHLIVAGIVLIVMAGSMLTFGQNRPRKIDGGGDDGDGKGNLPPCVSNSMCAQNSRSCVSSKNTGCCENRDGTCGTANPQTMVVFGGTITGFRLVRHLDTGEWSSTVGPERIPLDNFLAAYGEPVFSQVSRNIEGTFPEGGWWQYGLWIASVTGEPKLYGPDRALIKPGDFINNMGIWWERIPADSLGPRVFVTEED